MKTVSVTFNDSSGYNRKTYHYIYDLNEPVEKGDILVVNVSGEWKLVTVQLVEEGVSSKATKHIVDKVDTASYNKRQELERRRTVIRTQLESLLKSQEEILKYEFLAQKSTAARELLEELKAINGA